MSGVLPTVCSIPAWPGWTPPTRFQKTPVLKRGRFMSVIKMNELDLSGKRVLIRADLNVPVKNGKVTSDARILASLPTIEAALAQGAKVMVTSHLGRPTEGEYADEFSLQPVVDYLAAKLSAPVRLAKDYLSGV